MNTPLPTESEIIAFHKKYAPSDEIFQHIYSHCQAVWRIAEQLITKNNLEVDAELVKVACLLHDIGSYTLMQPSEGLSAGYAARGVEGARILKEEGLPQVVCEIVAHHVSHALTKERIKAGALDGLLPLRDLHPRTPEERLVNYVSKLHGRPEVPRFHSVEAYRKFVQSLGEGYYLEDFEGLVAEFGEPELKGLAREFEQNVK